MVLLAFWEHWKLRLFAVLEKEFSGTVMQITTAKSSVHCKDTNSAWHALQGESLGKTVLADVVAVPKISSGIQASPSFAITRINSFSSESMVAARAPAFTCTF